MSIPPGKGPHQVGCTDLMVGHTVHVSVRLNCVYSVCVVIIVCVLSADLKNVFIFLEGYVFETLLSVPSIQESSAARLGPVQGVF